MRLTDFLLARIAEDERLVAEYPDLTSDFPPKWELGLYYEDGIAMTLTVSADRLRAECEAKRRIVNMWADPFGQWNAAQADAARAQKDSTLRLLALPYADHPDYDEAWRP